MFTFLKPSEARKKTERSREKMLNRILETINFSIRFSVGEGKSYTKWYSCSEEEAALIPEIREELEKLGYDVKENHRSLLPSIAIFW